MWTNCTVVTSFFFVLQYINRPLPSTTHEARHSFQFNACTALLDGEVTPDSFLYSYRRRPHLHTLLRKTTLETPADNVPTFQDMYVEVEVSWSWCSSCIIWTCLLIIKLSFFFTNSLPIGRMVSWQRTPYDVLSVDMLVNLICLRHWS